MANKRLSLQDIELMKTMVSNGVAPEDISKHFNIAISSVHNYKGRFKADGLKFPDVRGKRPTGSIKIPSKQVYKLPEQEPHTITSSEQNKYNFTVNGVLVQVTGVIQSVNITKDGIEVRF